MQDATVVFKISAAGFILTSLIVIPDWPCFRRHPLPWQPVQSKQEESPAVVEKEVPKAKRKSVK